MPDSAYDLVVYGASGFVGELLAAHLARTAPADLRIALAGRSAAKLADVRSRLPEAARDWPLVTADSTDAASVTALAESTRVLVTTVGPYARYGLPVVEACAHAGTHYADLTGEVLFARDAIARTDAPARESGARIVHSCGFDSIPSDLAVLLLAERARADDAGGLTDVRLVATLRGGFSGGTIDSMRAQVEAVGRDRSLRRVVGDRSRSAPTAPPSPTPASRRTPPPPPAERAAAGPHRRDGLVQHPRRAAQHRAAGLGLRAGAALRRGHGRRPRRDRRRDRGRGHRGPGGCAGGDVVRADPRAAGPGAAGAGHRPGRGHPRAGLVPDDRGRRHRVRSAVPGDGRREGRSGLRGDGGDARRERAGPGARRRPAPRPRRLAHPATALGEVLVDRLRAAGHTYEVVEA